jgi:hypothetical protein
MAAKPLTNAFPISKVGPLTAAVFCQLITSQKLTQGSTGVWETVRKLLSVDPNRSNGIPLKSFRNPPPASLDPNAYDDPTTIPAADIADNPYWKRDVRRNYPKLSTVTQADTVGLLTVGSAANPSPKLLAGEEGQKQLVTVQEAGKKGLSAYFDGQKGAAVLGQGGLPPLPPSTRSPQIKATDYDLLEDQSYENKSVTLDD